MRKSFVDLTCDLGEAYGRYTLGMDEDILVLTSSANVACGFHAGDPHVMRKTVAVAKKHGVHVGAHPGLPDRVGFGRRAMAVSPTELKDIFTYQIGALRAFLEAEGMQLQHVFPHGALTAMIGSNEELGRAVLEAILETFPQPFFLSMPGSYLPKMGEEMGLRIARVALADRAYNPDQTLVNRQREGAVIQDPRVVAERIEELVSEGFVRSLDGQKIELEFDSILLHGDSPGAIKIAEAVVQTLRKVSVGIKPMSEII